MATNSFYFYVLECSDGSFYGGYTVDINNRLKAHNDGVGAKYTRARTPVSLIHYETFSTKSDAMKAEYQFKQLSRPKKEAYLEGAKQVEDTKKLSE